MWPPTYSLATNSTHSPAALDPSRHPPRLVRNGLASRPHFGVFLTDSEDLEPSEVAFGGADPQRMLEPISWSQARVWGWRTPRGARRNTGLGWLERVAKAGSLDLWMWVIVGGFDCFECID